MMLCIKKGSGEEGILFFCFSLDVFGPNQLQIYSFILPTIQWNAAGDILLKN